MGTNIFQSATSVASMAALLFFSGIACAKPYKSGEIYTLSAQTYGKYRLSMRAAIGSGVLSAFFLWKDGSVEPGNPWQEIDIEVSGKNNATGWQSNIITGTAGDLITSEQLHPEAFSFGEEFHTFILEWRPDSVTWYVDDILVRNSNEANSDQIDDLVSPAQLRFNLWASNATDWAGPWDASILPVYMHVDWIEYYAWDEAAADFELDPAWRDDFDNFDSARWGKANWTFDSNRADFIPENAYVQNGLLVLALTLDESGGSSSSSSSSSSSGSSGTASSSSGGRSKSGGGCLVLVVGAFLYFYSRKARREK